MRKLAAASLLLLFSSVTCPAFAGETVASLVPVPKALVEIMEGKPPQSLEDLRAMQQHVQQVADLISDCTVGVRVQGAQGSGVIVSEDGIVMTAAHVCQEPNLPCFFTMPDGTQYRGTTLGTYKTLDAGLMKIERKADTDEPYSGPYLERAARDSLSAGEWCLATGHPGGYEPDREPVIRLGRILTVDDEVIRTDCMLVGGDSGGPLCDMEGRVIGINSRIGNRVSTNLHVPVGLYYESWDRLLRASSWGKFGQSSKPVIGVSGNRNDEGALVHEVQEESPAKDAGLLVDDIVLEFGGKTVANFAALQGLVKKRKPGERVKLKVQRGDEVVELELVVGRS